MMIPPIIRVGPPPLPWDMLQKGSIVVLVRERGWCIAKWTNAGYLFDIDRTIPHSYREMNPRDVLCWMPEDGS